MKYILSILIVILLISCQNDSTKKNSSEHFTLKAVVDNPDSVKIISLGDYLFDKSSKSKTITLSEISKLKNLVELKVNGNHLEIITDQLQNFTNLKVLEIENSKDIDLEKLKLKLPADCNIKVGNTKMETKIISSQQK